MKTKPEGPRTQKSCCMVTKTTLVIVFGAEVEHRASLSDLSIDIAKRSAKIGGSAAAKVDHFKRKQSTNLCIGLDGNLHSSRGHGFQLDKMKAGLDRARPSKAMDPVADRALSLLALGSAFQVVPLGISASWAQTAVLILLRVGRIITTHGTGVALLDGRLVLSFFGCRRLSRELQLGSVGDIAEGGNCPSRFCALKLG